MSLLGNGLSGLLASQHTLNVTSQNIANVNTPGYSRQEALLAARGDNNPGRLNPGYGVEVTQIRRIADEYQSASLWRTSSLHGFDQQRQTLLEQAEDILAADALSVSRGLDEFFAALNASAEAPQSIASRQQVLSSATALADRYNELSNNLGLQQVQIDEQSQALTDTVNSHARSLAQLNSAITDVQAKGGNTAQLEDQRDLLVQELAGLMDVRAQRYPDGRMDVTLPAGEPLVLGGQAGTLTLTDGELTLSRGGQSFATRAPGGQLGALLTYRSQDLAAMQASLNQQASNLADQINSQLVQGYDLDGNPGLPLFTYDPAEPAGTLALNPAMGPEQLAFIGDDGTGNPLGGPGENSNLVALTGLKGGLYNDYTALVGELAIKTRQAQDQATASQALRDDSQFRRDATSGVNLDEEAIRLMEFTRNYQANARVISTADQLFNTLLGMFR